MNPSKSIRVLCADDHPLIRDGISFALQGEPDIELIANAENGMEAVTMYRNYRPDVVLLDLLMPRMGGVEALIAIKEFASNAKCIILTTYEGDAQASRALKAGAMGYLLKSMIRKRLVEAIRTVYAGQKFIPPEVAAEITKYLGVEDLTSRELQILRGVADGCSNKLIGDRLNISENTVKGHLKNIVGKLHANDRSHAVTLALKRGFLDT